MLTDGYSSVKLIPNQGVSQMGKSAAVKNEHQICSIAETAAMTGLSAGYLRSHAERLGGTRLGNRGHWRFIPAHVRERLFGNGSGPQSEGDRRLAALKAQWEKKDRGSNR
jgi:hypothetical protein